MTRGIRFYSYMDSTGYGQAALGYVSALLSANIPVQWVPLIYNGASYARAQPGSIQPQLEAIAEDESLRMLPEIIAATSAPVGADTALVHAQPEAWAFAFEPGLRNIGITTWETDRLPPHWIPILNQANAIWVPSRHNAAIFRAPGIHPPVHAVPHILRSRRNRFEPAEVEAFRASLGIPANHFVFYSINRWDPRKNLPQLMRTFAQAFTADQPVSLIIKTNPFGYGVAPHYQWENIEPQIAPVTAAIESELGRPLPSICVLPYELSGRGIDLIHALGDCYISLTHGEGWGIGGFEAAALGKPVIMTGWSGQMDYLNEGERGILPYSLEPVPIFPPSAPSMWPPQRWAEPDPQSAIEAMRSILHAPEPWLTEAARRAIRLQQQFSLQNVKPLVVKALAS